MSITALPRRSGDLLFGGHLVLALSMVFWRAFESVPGYGVEDGGHFTTSIAGRALALATLLASLCAAFAVVTQSARHWRDGRVLLLAATFALALSSRMRADLFDLVYVGGAIAFGVWWFRSARASAQPSV